MGMSMTPLMKGMMAVVSMENISPAPIMAAKRIITALSVSVTSPRAPVHAERIVAFSPFLRNSGVGMTGVFMGNQCSLIFRDIFQECHAHAGEFKLSFFVNFSVSEEIGGVKGESGNGKTSLCLFQM